MLYLLGTDEAGYGPNLGPLVIAASLWRVAARRTTPPDLYESLVEGVSPVPSRDGRVAIADSKQLYSAGQSLALLEQGVLAALATLGHSPPAWREIWKVLAECGPGELPWYQQFDCPLPRHVEAQRLGEAAQILQRCLSQGKVELVALKACVIHPAEFNEGCQKHDSKGVVLSQATLRLVRSLLSRCDGGLHIVCDKHGGRNHYAGLVWEELAAPECDGEAGFPVQVVRESRAESVYRWQAGQHAREIRFVAKGERYLPAALASMTAKYLRELAMLAFNDYWLGHFPDLVPTAGYPADASRFRAAIGARAKELALEPHTWWRER